METRRLGNSGFRVPVLSFGTVTFGGTTDFFRPFGSIDAAEGRRLVDLCLDVGVNMFDSADTYSGGLAEEILGQAIAGRRDKVIISTKASFRSGPGPNDVGSSRHHLIAACEAALRRLGTDYIDLFQLHVFDPETPVGEVLETLDILVRSGKVRYVGCSSFTAWQLMKSLGMADRHGYPRYVAHQAYYSLIGRDYEWELMPLALDQGVGAVVWSPLGWGRLTGRIRRGTGLPTGSRLHGTASHAPPVEDAHLFRVVDALDRVAAETGRTVAQVALNWLLQRPTVSTVIIGARHEAQLRDNLGAAGWSLTPSQMATLDEASAIPPPYPIWQQQHFLAERNLQPAASSDGS